MVLLEIQSSEYERLPPIFKYRHIDKCLGQTILAGCPDTLAGSALPFDVPLDQIDLKIWPVRAYSR